MNSNPRNVFNAQAIEYMWRTTIFRFIVATVILAITTLVFNIQRLPVYTLVAIAYALTIAYLIFLRLRIYLRLLPYLQVFFDLLLVSGLIYYTGSIDSILTLLYPLVIILAGVIIGPRSAVFTGLFASIIYTLVVVLEFLHLIPTINIYSDNLYIFGMLYFKVTIFCIVGFLSAYLCGQLQERSRTVAILETRLKSEEKLSAMGKFVAVIAHEIRNPLTSLSGAVEALRENLAASLNGENRALMDMIAKESQRLNNIISGLLEYARPKVLKKQSTDIGRLCEQTIAILKNNKDFNPQIRIRNELKDGKMKINCDPQKIQQAVLNLLINAVQSMPQGGEIEIIAIEQPRFIDIKISDQGQGIAAERVTQIFEPFHTDREGGVGLGLAIVRGIIEEHGGTITVESVLGKGARFILSLPRF